MRDALWRPAHGSRRSPGRTEQFVALGYIQPQTENQEKAVASAVRECKYNLSRDLMDCRQYSNALSLLEELALESPKEMRFKLQLAQCYLSLDRRAESKKLLQEVLEFKPEPQQKPAKANGNELAEPNAEAGVEAAEAEVAEMAVEDGQAKAETAPEEAAPEKETASRAWADWLVGTIELADGKPEEGLASLLRAEQAEPLLPNLHLRLGETYLRCKRIDDAKRAFQRAWKSTETAPKLTLASRWSIYASATSKKPRLKPCWPSAFSTLHHWDISI